MRFLLSICFTLCLVVHGHSQEQKFDAKVLAETIAPFVDEQTIAVIRVHVAGIDFDALVNKLMPAQKGDAKQMQEERKAVGNWLSEFAKAGGKDIYLVVSMADLPEGPFAVIPLNEESNPQALAKLLTMKPEGNPAGVASPSSPFRAEVAEKIGAAVFAGSKKSHERLRTSKASPRPELSQALSAVANATIQVAVIPSANIRRTFNESLPTLPKEWGGGPITILTQGVMWASLGVSIAPKFEVQLVVQSKDGPAAQALSDWIGGRLRWLGEQQEIRANFAQFDQLTAQLQPKLAGDRLTSAMDEQPLTALLLPAIQRIRAASSRAVTSNNLKQIGLALHSYHDVHKAFPSGASHDNNGKPLLSWRVHILPFLDQEKLYKQFHLDEPWDSEHNKKLIAQMPAVYQSSPKLAQDGKTTYLGVSGPKAMFSENKPVAFGDVTDGTSNTVFVVDAEDESGVIWTKPDDLNHDPAKPFARLSRRYAGGFMALFVDGSVRFLSEKLKPQTLNALFTRNGGEIIEDPSY
jgi:hypothetical protein